MRPWPRHRRPHPGRGWYATHGISVERVLSDNGGRLLLVPVARHMRRARHHCEDDPAIPATNQRKIERSHRTLADGWAYAHHYVSEAERRAALAGWLNTITTGPTQPPEANPQSED